MKIARAFAFPRKGPTPSKETASSTNTRGPKQLRGTTALYTDARAGFGQAPSIDSGLRRLFDRVNPGLSKKAKHRFLVANTCSHVLVATLIFTATFASADAVWGSIGGGWTSLDGTQVESKKPQPAALAKPVRTRQQSAGQVASAAPRSENRTLVRNVAQRFANHNVLRRSGIPAQEFVIFFESMIEIESRYNHRALSRAGAIGLAQLMPGTARYLNVDPYDRFQNVEGGARYLIEQIDEFGTLSLAVAAYNAGPKAVRKHNGVPPYPETERHVARVLSIAERRWRKASRSE